MTTDKTIQHTKVLCTTTAAVDTPSPSPSLNRIYHSLHCPAVCCVIRSRPKLGWGTDRPPIPTTTQPTSRGKSTSMCTRIDPLTRNKYPSPSGQHTERSIARRKGDIIRVITMPLPSLLTCCPLFFFVLQGCLLLLFARLQAYTICTLADRHATSNIYIDLSLSLLLPIPSFPFLLGGVPR